MMHDNADYPSHPHTTHRTRNLTNEDIEEIVRQVNNSRHLDCRFDNISADDLEEAIQFYKNFNKFMSESSSTIWKAILVIGVGGVLGLIVLGIYAKIREHI